MPRRNLPSAVREISTSWPRAAATLRGRPPQNNTSTPRRRVGRETARRALPCQERPSCVSGGGLSEGLRRLQRGLPRRQVVVQGRQSRKGGPAARSSRIRAGRAFRVSEDSRRRGRGVDAASPRTTRLVLMGSLPHAQDCVWVSRFMNRLAALGDDGRFGRVASRKSTRSAESDGPMASSDRRRRDPRATQATRRARRPRGRAARRATGSEPSAQDRPDAASHPHPPPPPAPALSTPSPCKTGPPATALSTSSLPDAEPATHVVRRLPVI